ncbi:MAG: S1 RNA-binding domain-containing protein [Pirellulales bacterium]|nr:S1 RNA-binding domain-containing protein [Pirellulales bacterium]
MVDDVEREEGSPETEVTQAAAAQEVDESSSAARRIRIGSQRDQGKPQPALPTLTTSGETQAPAPAEVATVASAAPASYSPTDEPAEAAGPVPQTSPAEQEKAGDDEPRTDKRALRAAAAERRRRANVDEEPIAPANKRFPPPNKRHNLPPELEQELQDALGDLALDDILTGSTKTASTSEELTNDTRVKGRIVSQHNEFVFIDLGNRNEGVIPLKQFTKPPEIGAEVEAVVQRFDAEEGLYELGLAGAAANVADWSDIAEGMLVDVRVTGHNKGGLECEVNNLRGFIPAGQASLYRIEDLGTLVGERFTCVITEANPERRNLVLSRRAVLEREQAENKKKLLEELQPGEIREGVVRNIRDFGAFVDLGGVDGLLHVGKLSWARVKHPSDLLEVGQKVRVIVERIDPNTHKISLGMRDLFENPWNKVAAKYPPRATVRGRVTKLMEFGAFVELEPGIEGLVHISELAHKRVFRVADVVKEGDEIEAQVISVDQDAQRISLSIKALQARPEPIKKDAAAEAEEAINALPPVKKTDPNLLKGGRKASSGGEKFGLKW